MKLYDMDKHEWIKGNFRTGDTWRSIKTYKCVICHTLTNRWVKAGRPRPRPVLRCPGDIYHEHDDLKEAYGLYEEITGPIRVCRRLQALTGRTDKFLNRMGERRLLLRHMKDLRERFDCDDVAGRTHKTEWYYPSFSSGPERRLIR